VHRNEIEKMAKVIKADTARIFHIFR